MDGPRIDVLAERLLEAMVEAGYADNTVAMTRYVLRDICARHHEAGSGGYDQKVVDSFVADTIDGQHEGRISVGQRRLYLRTARRLGCLNEGELEFGRRPTKETGLCPSLGTAVSSLAANREWSRKTAENVRRAAIPYLRWIQGRGIDDLAMVDAETVRAYFVEASGRMEPGSLDAIRRRLRKLHEHLANEGLARRLDDAFSFAVRVGHRIGRPASHDELASTLAQVDRGDPKGKRDYAVILLGAVLGLRGIDIVGLALGDVDWANGEIAVRQSKTGRVVALPLTADVGLALQDYLLAGRPSSEDGHVFLSCRAPFGPLGSTVPYQVLNSYRRKADLPPTQFHSLRRAVGTNLVIGGTPVSTVAQILGHSDIDSTRQYISLDTEHLKGVAIDLRGLPPMRWGASE